MPSSIARAEFLRRPCRAIFGTRYFFIRLVWFGPSCCHRFAFPKSLFFFLGVACLKLNQKQHMSSNWKDICEGNRESKVCEQVTKNGTHDDLRMFLSAFFQLSLKRLNMMLSNCTCSRLPIKEWFGIIIAANEKCVRSLPER